MTPFRSVRAAGLLLLGSAAVVALPAGSASATTAEVSVTNFQFTPAHVSVSQGGSVGWTFHAMHTSTSNQDFWNSGRRASGTYTVHFPDAGRFGYHCTMHPSMTGSVAGPMRAAGSASAGWRIVWSSRSSTPANRRYDVQVRKPGGSTWSPYRSASAARSSSFDPARSGSYVFRARTRNGSHGASGWSPHLSLRIS
ncbi:cupredoxin domain-containing protein [Nocardioides terrisoli]|uniref:hypothetical protein n=1 Tax=Nocardioides terrisoli TaxID=3388267 RepID=UPI00287B99BD|nr:hypothetical protein [Nocardioides marmorisolisilvae]